MKLRNNKNEELEDYEEPKEYYFISDTGYICSRTVDSGESWDKFRKDTGNYFKTKEEAEKAVEKLKAWKRLKDKGFEFIGFSHIGASGWVKGEVKFLIPGDRFDDEVEKDLDFLFGGEE